MSHITPDWLIDDIVKKHPTKSSQIVNAIQSIGLQCVGCGKSSTETLEEGMAKHGYGVDETQALCNTINDIINKRVNQDQITITQRAAKKILQFMEQNNKLGWLLLFGERKGGCGGLEYYFEYVKNKTDIHQSYQSGGIEILIDKSDMNKLIGSEIDYVESLFDSGFKISNPNVTRSCHCGSSHSYKNKKQS